MKILVLILAMISVAHAGLDLSKPREWKSTKGKAIKGSLVTYDSKSVTLKLVNGKQVTFKASLLSKEDVTILNKWRAEQKKNGLPTGPFTWKSRFTGDATPKVDYVGYIEKEKCHLYRTEHFDFYIEEKLTNTTVSRCVAIFDSIVGALDQLPLQLDTTPKGGRQRYRALLVASQERYMKLGGIKNSGGFFSPSRNLTVIPLQSMGIVKKGMGYAFDGKNRNYGILVHELTHHSTSHWNALPAWFEEGLADYMAAMPYRSGSFNFANPGGYISSNVKRKYRRTKYEKEVLPKGVLHSNTPEHLFTISRRQWNKALEKSHLEGGRNYVSSMVLFYYFAHLDGKGDGMHLTHYIHAHQRARMRRQLKLNNDLTYVKKHLLRGRSYEELMKDMKTKLAKKGLKIHFVGKSNY